MIDSSCGSKREVLRRIGLARSCINMLKRIWKSSIRLETKLRLYQTYIVPVLMYGCETWATTKYLLSPRCIWHMGTTQDLEDTAYSPCLKCGSQKNHWLFTLSHLVTNRRLRLFGSSPRQDHNRALAACVRQVPPDWKRPAGRPSHTWLREIEADLVPLNFGLTTAWRKATTRDEWRHIVDTATLQRSTLWKKTLIAKRVGHRHVFLFSHLTYFVHLLYLEKLSRPKYQ